MHRNTGDRVTMGWVEFGRMLRRNGVQTSATQVREVLAALDRDLVQIGDRDAVYLASRSLLCTRHEDWPRFDLVFRQYWGRTRQMMIPSDYTTPRPETQTQEPVRANPGPPPNTEAGLPLVERRTAVDGPENEGEIETSGERPERVLVYSAHERLRDRDFSAFTEEEMAEARTLLANWRWEPGARRTRRLRPARRGARLHLEPTLRRAMRTGGVPFALSWRGPRTRPRPLVFLCDISGSMAPYTRVLLHFLYTLHRQALHLEVFLFATRLTRITRALQARSVDAALAEVSHTVVDWSGGTRMGQAFRTFNTTWARRVLGQGAIVCIISDGWDRGDPALLAGEMAYLQRTAFRLIWLNPLLGVPGYQPLTRGMAAALRYVDDFLPAHNLRSLENLANLLSTIPASRPGRKHGGDIPLSSFAGATI